MDNYKRAPQLKAIAKERSLGKYGTLIGANVLIIVIQLFVTAITTVATGGSIILIVINNIITLIVNILLGLLVSGKAYLYMNLLYSQTVSTSDIFYGLRQNPQKAVTIQALFVVIDFVVTLPSQVLLVMYQHNPGITTLSYLIMAMGIGLIVDVMIYLTYSQAFFILHDFPDRSAKEILATSRHLMKGNKFRLFYLNVTFLPLYLFSAIALFVPLLWVSVYRYASTCAFYQDLIANAAAPSTTQPVPTEL